MSSAARAGWFAHNAATHNTRTSRSHGTTEGEHDFSTCTNTTQQGTPNDRVDDQA